MVFSRISAPGAYNRSGTEDRVRFEYKHPGVNYNEPPSLAPLGYIRI